MVELGEQVCWEVPGMTQQKFEDRCRIGNTARQRERSDENLMSQTPTECTLPDPCNVYQCRAVGTRRKSKT